MTEEDKDTRQLREFVNTLFKENVKNIKRESTTEREYLQRMTEAINKKDLEEEIKGVKDE